MKSYTLTEEAEQDIDAIKTYLIGKGGPPLVIHVLDKIETTLEFLGNRPGLGHDRTDLTNEPVKFWQVFSYLIVYDPLPHPIHVIRIAHASRNIRRLLGG